MFWGYRTLAVELGRILLELREYRRSVLRHWFWDVEQRAVCLKDAWQWDVCTSEEQRDVCMRETWQRDVCIDEGKEQRNVCLEDAWQRGVCAEHKEEKQRDVCLRDVW